MSTILARSFIRVVFNQPRMAGLFFPRYQCFSNEIKRVKEDLQGDSPFEINSSRQMMIADKRVVRGEVPQQRGQSQYNNAPRQRRAENNTKMSLNKSEIEIMLPQLNSVRNFYQVMENFTEQNFLDLVSQTQITKNPNNTLALNNIWTYARKYRIFHSYRTPYFQHMADTISNNLDLLEVPENVSGFAFNLYKVSYAGVEPYQKIEKYALEKMESFPLRALAQIVFSFSAVSRNQTQHDFSSMYAKMQIVIALKLREAILSPTPDIEQLQKDFNQVLAGYSRSQNLSKEFLYVLEQFIITHITNFRPREKTSALYTFAVNGYCSQPLVKACIDEFLQSYDSFNPQEMCHLLVSLDKLSMLDETVMKLVREQFLLKKDQINLLDLADVCSVMFKREFVDEEFFTTTRSIFKDLRQNVEINVLTKLLTNASSLLNKELMPHRFFKTLMQSLQIISYSKDLKGRLIDELKADAVKILHPQFQQQYSETLENLRKLDYKQMKTQSRYDKEERRDEKQKKHYQIEGKKRTRADMKDNSSKNDEDSD